MQKNNLKKGQIVIISALFSVFISSILMLVMASPVISHMKISRDLDRSKQSFFTAESGSEDVVYRIKTGMNVSPQEELELNGGKATIVISDVGDGVKEIISAGNNEDRIRKIKNNITISSGISFNYGLYVGQGGVEFDNNTKINGSVYSNGNIEGESNSIITGDVYVATQISTTTDTEWTSYNDDFIFGREIFGQDRIDVAQSFSPSSERSYLAKASMYLKKVGSPSNISVKITEDKNGKPDKNDIVTSGTISSNLIGTEYSFVDVSFNENEKIKSDETYWMVLDLTEDNENYYVWGFDNTDGYGRGTAKFSSNWITSSFININGDLNFKIWVSDSEKSGVLDKVTVYGSAYAHTITDSDVGGNVYANYFSGGSVGGNITANSISDCTISNDANYNFSSNCNIGGVETTPTIIPVDPPFLSNPISEANIDSWKNIAIEGGVISSGDFTPTNNQIIGPGVIEGDLIINDSITVSLSGNVYVKGNIQISNNSEVNLISSSRVLLSNGWVSIGLNVFINDTRTENNHLMILSLAKCDDIRGEITCTDEEASISVGNNTEIDILSAPYGAIKLDNNVTAVSLIGSELDLKNNTILNYEQGLTNLNFSSGPSGAWVINSWREVE